MIPLAFPLKDGHRGVPKLSGSTSSTIMDRFYLLYETAGIICSLVVHTIKETAFLLFDEEFRGATIGSVLHQATCCVMSTPD